MATPEPVARDSAAPADPPQRHPGLQPGHAVRVVRLLSLRQPRRLLRRAVLSRRATRRAAAPRQPGHLRRRLRRAAARRDRLRPHRRSRSAASTPSSSPWRPWASSTALIGFLPTYAQRGARRAGAPGVACASLQGLALGGEYGGAATYVAEHVPDDRRGYYTSFIQTTATLGFFVSLGVIGDPPHLLGAEALQARAAGASRSCSRSCCWRCRSTSALQMKRVAALHAAQEPRARSRRTRSRRASATREPAATCCSRSSARPRARASSGTRASSTRSRSCRSALKLDWKTAPTSWCRSRSLLGTPLFVFFGRLSDRIGRKKIMLAGCLLGALTYVPIFMAMKALREPARACRAADPGADQPRGHGRCSSSCRWST